MLLLFYIIYDKHDLNKAYLLDSQQHKNVANLIDKFN